MLSNKILSELEMIIGIANKNNGCIGESFIRDSIGEVNSDRALFMQVQDYLLSKNVNIEFENGVEDLDESIDNTTIKPFDTSKIDISPKTFSLDIIISRLENDEIDMLPDFQRKAGLWSLEQKSQLIESLILRIPLPAFYFDGSDNKWIVIDGLQRLTTIKEFFVDKTLHLRGLEFLKELEGSNCDGLPRSYIRRMKETSIITYIINPGAPINLKFNIFKRINTGGLKLEAQEIRHALFQGFATTYLKELANLDSFKRATGYSIKTDRMLDREFVLRFIAFYELGVDNYNGFIDEYLNEAMELLNKKYSRDVSIAENTKRMFELVLDVSYEIFGMFSFRRMPDMIRRRSISKALFEAWTVILARYDVDELQIFVEKKDQIKKAYMKLFIHIVKLLSIQTVKLIEQS
ncbi:MAG: DUF262 domain-containing protein [Clostridia bacterium]|nr:DUF262 domain-containing protein [Clostridia bacterium]